MSRYEALAQFYDELTPDVQYREILDFYELIFDMYGIKPQLVFDLACGTGTLTWLMAQRGYETLGIDASQDMLSKAMEKGGGISCGVPPVFVCQELAQLDMYGTADAAVCCLDGMNYIPISELAEVFRRLNLFIRPGGVLIFDINTPYKLKGLDGQMFIDESDDVYCVWRTEFDSSDNSCFYGMDIFAEESDGRYTRYSEEHIEYAHEAAQLCDMLKHAGFEDVRVFGDRTKTPPKDDELRVYISARNTR